jgi:hypothetical protein
VGLPWRGLARRYDNAQDYIVRVAAPPCLDHVASITPTANPYRMAAIQGRVVDVRLDEDCRYMDPISVKYTNAPFPSRGRDRVCFVITVEKASSRTLDFVHNPS